MIFKPHSLTVNALQETLNGKVVQVPLLGAAVVVTGQLTPDSTPGVTMDKSTAEILKNPHIFFCEVADVPSLPYGARCSIGSRRFVVRDRPDYYDALGGVTNHAAILLEELEMAP